MYIKREDAIKVIKQVCKDNRCLSFIERIVRIPSADVVEVVRCKECKYYKPFTYTRPYPCFKGLEDAMHDDFCSHGERRE